MVEIALAFPLLMTLALGVADLGRGFYAKEAVINGARQGLRVLAQSQSVADQACASAGTGPVTFTNTIPNASGVYNPTKLNTAINSILLETSKDGTPGGSALGTVANPATLVVTFHCISGAGATNSSNKGTDPSAGCSSTVCSDSIELKIQYTFHLITPFVSNVTGGDPVIVSDLTGRVEY